ncbi:HCL199Cp [Eremothecium sinecaudum]|uniref:Protein LOT5 n=1 Tax=Eremothecium sinecaudum TaxID=45286 RepID=A0A109UYJ7_9SACH|nr:HCL199Cp [Eremothecium sinecaudum]AMD19952.1 HCL199Cp [Eremothecium sinecaudum]
MCSCQIVYTRPTLENTISYKQYEKTYPRMKGFPLTQQSELPVLYGGGRNFYFGLLPTNDTQPFEDADLFVLDSCIVIWLQAWDRGLQIPYQGLVYHAVRKVDTQQIPETSTLELIITVERDDVLNQFFPVQTTAAAYAMSTVELVLRPKYGNHDRHYNVDVETLFTFRDFGLNRGNAMVLNSNKAIATCMDLHESASSTEEDACQSQNTYTQDENDPNLNPNNTYMPFTTVLNDIASAHHLASTTPFRDITTEQSTAGVSLQFYADLPLAGTKQPRPTCDDNVQGKRHKDL